MTRRDRHKLLLALKEEVINLERYERLGNFEHLRGIIWKLHPELEELARLKLQQKDSA